MIAVSHPTGNMFVRALLSRLSASGQLHTFHTTIVAPRFSRSLPAGLRSEMERRSYDLPSDKVCTHPFREMVRLASAKFGMQFLTRHETGFASLDAVYQNLDAAVAQWLPGQHGITAVYCYEDGALETFRTAQKLGIQCVYELPIMYWETAQRLLREEAARLPRWAPTLGGNRDSENKLRRKTKEIELADVVICPSLAVLDSLPRTIQSSKKCIVAEFGSPSSLGTHSAPPGGNLLRILFAGSMTQRKGLADLFTAFKALSRRDISLVVMGSPVAPPAFYREEFPDFVHQPPRPHSEVLALMETCDALVLPSIVEGRALVQQEAMSRGLPLIVTANAGGEDLIVEGETGFLVPIRSPERLAERIAWLADHRNMLADMRLFARRKAAEYTWESYAEKILNAIAT